MICLTHPTLVVRRQPLVRLPFVVEHPGEVAVWPVSPYGATPIVTASIDIAGDDAAGGILTTVGAPDDLGLIRARRHAYRDLTRTHVRARRQITATDTWRLSGDTSRRESSDRRS